VTLFNSYSKRVSTRFALKLIINFCFGYKPDISIVQRSIYEIQRNRILMVFFRGVVGPRFHRNVLVRMRNSCCNKYSFIGCLLLNHKRQSTAVTLLLESFVTITAESREQSSIVTGNSLFRFDGDIKRWEDYLLSIPILYESEFYLRYLCRFMRTAGFVSYCNEADNCTFFYCIVVLA